VTSFVSGGSSGDHTALAAAARKKNEKKKKTTTIGATPDMAALVAALLEALECRVRGRSSVALARQAALVKEVESVSKCAARLQSRTLDAGSEAMQASQDIVHEMDLAKHHVLHILEMAEQVKAMLPQADAARLPDSPFGP
jgi:hypothetical protein